MPCASLLALWLVLALMEPSAGPLRLALQQLVLQTLGPNLRLRRQVEPFWPQPHRPVARRSRLVQQQTHAVFRSFGQAELAAEAVIALMQFGYKSKLAPYHCRQQHQLPLSVDPLGKLQVVSRPQFGCMFACARANCRRQRPVDVDP